jgi:rfaE bifunctional protein nucleotidyltransferase chain/domain
MGTRSAAAVPRASAPHTLDELVAERRTWRERGLRLSLANGCFDILHPGHVALLEAAKQAADLLVVALNSDSSVRAIKGPERPVIPEWERAETLLALEAVDRVLLYDEPTPERVINALVPDVLVKGADWTLDRIVGRQTVEAAGGHVLRIELLEGRSTSGIVERIRTSRQAP